MTDREIMQKALDMIDKLTWALETHLYIKAPSDAKPLMKALRQALAQPEFDTPESHIVKWSIPVDPNNFGEPLAQPEQKPVAHLWECIGRWSSYLALNGEKANLAPPEWLVAAVKAATAQPESQVCCGDYEKCMKPCTPRGRWLAEKELRKEWVGLTINEVWDVYEEGNYDAVQFARAIEAKLKEKNT